MSTTPKTCPKTQSDEPDYSDGVTAEQAVDHRVRMRALREEQRKKVSERKEKRGVLIVNTGDGKGKSTAAYGTALRSIGHGKRVGMVLFVKGSWKTGEKEIFPTLPNLDFVVAGEGFTWDTQDLERDIACARHGWERAVEMIEAARLDPSAYHLIVLDELNIAIRYGYIPIDEVVSVLDARPEHLNVIVTGRDAKPALIDIADTVSEMVPVRHAFQRGIRAQRGIEF